VAARSTWRCTRRPAAGSSAPDSRATRPAVGTTASLQIAAAGSSSSAKLTYSATGLAIASGTGLISGTPTTVGTCHVTATATDDTDVAGSTTFTWTVNPAGVGTRTGAGQKFGNPGFESGNATWSASSGVIGQYGSRGEPPPSGTWDAWLDGYGSSHTDSLSQPVTIPTGRKATLSFYLQKTLALSSLAGQTVTIAFTGAEDQSLQTSFVLDDTTLTVS
jgi:hypothetical protein